MMLSLRSGVVKKCTSWFTISYVKPRTPFAFRKTHFTIWLGLNILYGRRHSLRSIFLIQVCRTCFRGEKKILQVQVHIFVKIAYSLTACITQTLLSQCTRLCIHACLQKSWLPVKTTTFDRKWKMMGNSITQTL